MSTTAPASGVPSTARTWPWNSSGGAGLVLAHLQRALGGELRRVRHVVRPLDRALGPLAVGVGDLLDHVLDPHVEEQRPLAVQAHLDHPGLEGVVLLVGDLLVADHVVHGLDRCRGHLVDALLADLGARGALLALEHAGGVGAGLGGLGVELGGLVELGHGGSPRWGWSCGQESVR